MWANWSLREPSEFDLFNKEWVRWFPGDTPIGQQTLMPPLQRRAGFRVSIGVIAEAPERGPRDVVAETHPRGEQSGTTTARHGAPSGKGLSLRRR